MSPAQAPPPLSPRAQEIVAAARALLEEEGAQALSMRRVAARLGIRGPSLYEHVASKRALEAAVISSGFVSWAQAAESAGAADADPLAAIARTYREWALEHPHLYRLMTGGPLAREALAPGAEARAARVLLVAVGGDVDLARAFWSFAHGMVVNELNGRYPPGADVDAAWARGVDAFRVRPRAPAA